MLTRRQAFSARTTVATLAAIVLRARRFDSGIAQEVQPLLARCLEKDPGQRFQTAADLMAALHGVQRALGRGRIARAALRASAAIWNNPLPWLKWTPASPGLPRLPCLALG